MWSCNAFAHRPIHIAHIASARCDATISGQTYGTPRMDDLNRQKYKCELRTHWFRVLSFYRITMNLTLSVLFTIIAWGIYSERVAYIVCVRMCCEQMLQTTTNNSARIQKHTTNEFLIHKRRRIYADDAHGSTQRPQQTAHDTFFFLLDRHFICEVFLLSFRIRIVCWFSL